MKQLQFFFIVIIITIFVFSCKKKTVKNIIRPVKTIEISNNTLLGKTFPGYVEAEEYAYVNFRVGGMLQILNVEEGQNVKKGDLIASLDKRDYQLKVSSMLASFQQSTSQLERYKRLYDKDAISKQEYEMTQALNENNKAAYNKSVNDLKYTELNAPFNGNIEKKYVENHQQVNAGEKIVKLTNPEKLQFRFTLPENNIQLIKDSITCSIAMDIDRNTYYNAKIVEVVSASLGGSGIPVILKIKDASFNAKKLRILPGYACYVKIEADHRKHKEIAIPLSCIYLDPKTKETVVWKVNTQQSIVNKVPIKTGELTGDKSIIVLSGLQPGDRIVSAGVNMLEEGEKIKIID